MSNKNTSILLALTNTQTAITNNPQVKTDITELPDLSDTLDTKIANIQLALKKANKTSAVSAQDVAAIKKSMSTEVFKLVHKAFIHCESEGNTALKEKFVFPSDYISKADKSIAAVRASDICTLITTNAADLPNILPAAITAVKAIISNYDAVKDLPLQNRKDKKNEGNTVIATEEAEGLIILHQIMTLIKDQYQLTNPELYNTFVSATTVVITGVRHTPVNINLICSITGNPVKNAEISTTTAKGITKTFKSNQNGVVIFKTHKSGNTTYTVKAVGIVDSSFTIKVKPSQSQEFTITLVPKMLGVTVLNKELPVANYAASVVDTDIVGTTDATGKTVLYQIPDKGTLEVSNEDGNIQIVSYNLGNLKKLNLTVNF